jgi:hypothetical protein
VAEQSSVSSRVPIDPSSRRWDYLPILEVPGQGGVVRRQGARAGDKRQRQDMVVVGHAPVGFAQAGFLRLETTRIGGSKPACLFQPDQQVYDFGQDRQLPTEFASGHQPRFSAIPKKPVGDSARLRQKPLG